MLGGRRDHDPPENLDRLLQDCAPGCRPDDDHRHRLRMQLDHNLRHHSVQSRLAPIAALFLVAALGILKLTDVGSGGFQLEETDRLIDDKVVLEDPLGNFRISNTESGPTISLDQRKYLESLYESVESGQGKLVGGAGWTVAGNTMFFLNYEHTVNGKSEIMTESPQAPDRKAGLEIYRFLQTGRDDFLGKVAAGLIPPAGRVEKELSGHTILYSTWTAPCPGWGEITYWEYVSHR